jgi:nitrate reductase assembly molybdenum cofactor insertion protein NarJ
VELIRALGCLTETPSPQGRRIAEVLELGPLPDAAAHSDLFDLQLPPYASVYLGPEGMLGGEARDRIAGFWRALKLTPPPEPDHLAVMLSFYARLAELESGSVGDRAATAWAAARRAFLWEHLVSWLPVYAARVRELAGAFYSAWAERLLEVLRAETAEAGTPERLSLHLRGTPPLVDPRQGGLDRFTASLLAPARSGMILVRADFQRASGALEIGARIAGRQVVLRGLLSQDAAGTLAWLGAEASMWARRHRGWTSLESRTAGYWRSRAEAAGILLNELAAEAGSSDGGALTALSG